MEKVVGIIGASGLIGSHLAEAYEAIGWRVIRYSRERRSIASQEWRLLSKENLEDLNVLVNLAGERIDQRWTEANKKRFYQSRVGVTAGLMKMLESMSAEERPQVLLNASAVGIYGNSGEYVLTENSNVGSGYLAELVEQWETAAAQSALEGCRIVFPRIGVVLGRKSAAWSKMQAVFKLGLGGRLGSGKQWFPWVHIEDLVEAFIYIAADESVQGAVNIVAPNSVTNFEFTKELSSKLKRPVIFPVPAVVLKLLLGEFASALLASHRVEPAKLAEIGFKWRFPELNVAIEELLD